jgi:hypothetical protein
MRKGQKLLCNKTINNFMGMPLFIEGKEYEVLYVDHEKTDVQVCINHVLYANEYNTFPVEWVRKNFKEI